MKRMTLNASLLRIILSVSLLVVAGAASAVFIYGKQFLTDYAIEVSHKKVDADASNGSIQALKNMEQELAKNQDVSQKIDTLKAANELPQFKIVDDVTKYAEKNQIAISSFDFAEAAVPGAATTPQTPATPGATPTPTPVISSAKSVSIVVTLGTSLNYLNLLQFIYDIEQNLPKMQIDGIGLTPDTTSPTDVSSDALTIQMYTK